MFEQALGNISDVKERKMGCLSGHRHADARGAYSFKIQTFEVRPSIESSDVPGFVALGSHSIRMPVAAFKRTVTHNC
jgi:hypothetical protein